MLLSSIKNIVWSHRHMCHTGDPSFFPPDMSLVVGPGFKIKPEDVPGLSREPQSLTFPRGALEGGRRLIELDGDGDGAATRRPGIGGLCDRLVWGRLILHRGGARSRVRERPGARAHDGGVCAARAAPLWESISSQGTGRVCDHVALYDRSVYAERRRGLSRDAGGGPGARREPGCVGRVCA
ncbi:hypothetical protein BC826DRAFT_1051925 [Russula brevipes]|nr:hypothetical protein BC826DRAFT_1051925 [Russula brevipes]